MIFFRLDINIEDSLGAMILDYVALHAGNLGAAALLLTVTLWLRYATQFGKLMTCEKRDTAKCNPPTFPYIFPLLGSLPVAYLWNPKAFVLNPK